MVNMDWDRAAEKRKEAHLLMRRYSARWMAIDGVVACGIGLSNDKDPTSVVIKIYVRQLGPRSLRKLPRKVNGIPIVIEKGGEIRALRKR